MAPPVTKKFKAKLTRSFENSGWHFLVIDRKIAEKFPTDGRTRRVTCSINGCPPFQCALMPWGEIYYILVNKKRREELGLEVGDTVEVVLTEDRSKYGLPMPREFAEVLKQDREGSKLFHSLTPGKQRSMLYVIGNLKDIDRRIHAGLTILEHLKENHGKIDHSKLASELKRPVNW